MSETTPIDQATVVRQGEELDSEQLTRFLREHIPDYTGPLIVEQFPRGFSNLTYLLHVGERELVLRRPPFGANIRAGHDMKREYRILSSLAPVFPKVPRPLVYSEDPAILGAPFYIMERVSGIILRESVARSLSIEPDAMHAICQALLTTLVEIHAIDYVAAGLQDLGKPEGYVARQVSGWTQRYANARTDPIPEMDQLAAWLQAHIPPATSVSLIHNDYRYDNVVLDAQDLTQIKAVLDWEMATLGDPLTDVGTTLAYWAEPGDPAEIQGFGPTRTAGNLNRQQFVERYAQQSQRDVSHILFYYVYGLFKNAVIVQQIYYRYVQGFTRDERFAHIQNLLHACTRMATTALEKGRISALFS